MAEDVLEREFRQVCKDYQQALSRKTLVPPERWNLEPGSWFVYSLNSTRNIFDSMSSQVADLMISLNHETMEDPVKRHDLETNVRGSPGACLEVLLLIFFRGDLEMLRRYGTYILDDTEGLSKMALPLSEKVFTSVFGPNVNVGRLYEAQYLLFCPIIKEGEFDIVVDRRSRMPYEEEKLLEEGASGKVYAVKVAAKHYQMLGANNPDSETVEIARKDFHNDASYPEGNNVSLYQNEVNVYKAFSKPQTNHHNIATAVSSIVYGTDGDLLTVKSIFFKLAKFDLDGYLQNQDIFPGSKRVSETLHDIRQMVDICHALAWLSKLLSYHSPSDSIKLDQYYHGDLKPANILVYGNPSQYNTLVFKISDFGETQRWNLHIDSKKSRIPGFFRKVLIHQTSVDTRPGTYCAPEKALGERSDIWSFGCIFLLVIAANMDGHCAVEYFSNARRGRNQKCSNENCDWFFEDDDKMQERKVNEEVTQYIKDFIKYCNNTGDGMTETCLKLIRDEMIQPKPRQRTSAEDLYKKLAASYNERHAVKFVSIDHDRELTKGEKVCSAAISPSGKLEAFLCTNTIYVWNTQLSRYTSKPIMLHTTSVDGNGGFKPILLCGEDMVCKIGSIAGSLQIELFSLKWSNYRAERSYKSVRRFQLSSEKLHTATLSADGNYLAIVCQSTTSSRPSNMNFSETTSIRLFGTAQLCLGSNERLPLNRTGSSLSSSRDSDAGLTLPDHLEESLSESAMVNEHLVFSTNNSHLYRINRKPRDGIVDRSYLLLEVWQMYGTSWHRIKQSQIEVRAQAPRTGDKKVASMAPLHNQVGFIGSLSPDSICLCVIGDTTKMTEALVKDRGSIVNVFIAQDDERVVILADRGGNLAILGTTKTEIESGRYVAKSLDPDVLDVRGPFKYVPTDGDRACLLEMGDGVLTLLLSRPDKRKSFTINVSRLFHSG